MIDNERLSGASCRNCGDPLNQNESDHDQLCPRCRGLQPGAGLTFEHLGSEAEQPLGEIGRSSSDGGEMHGDQIQGIQTSRIESHGSETRCLEFHGRENGSIEGIGIGTGGNETGGEIGGYQSSYSGMESEYVTTVPVPEPYDPDRPPWGVPAGIGTWLFSVVAIIMIPAFV